MSCLIFETQNEMALLIYEALSESVAKKINGQQIILLPSTSRIQNTETV